MQHMVQCLSGFYCVSLDLFSFRKRLVYRKFLFSFLIDSDPNLIETQSRNLKLTPNLTLTQTLTQSLILTLKKNNQKMSG